MPDIQYLLDEEKTVEKSKKNINWKRRVFPFLLLTPALLLWAIFTLYPTINGLMFSFMKWDGFTEGTWIGLKNYKDAIQDNIFWNSLSHNVIYAFSTVIGKCVIGLLLAVLLNQKMKGISFFRTTIFIPVILSFVAVGLLWSWVYNPVFGLINNFLNLFGFKNSIAWLGNPDLALGSLIAVDIWKWSGYHMILFLAGLQNISKDLYEAAEVDGATKWQSFLRVTLPLLMPVVIVNTTIAFLGGFNVFDLVYVMTGGGPMHATEVIMTYTYQTAFKFHSMGYGSAMSYLLFIVIAIITVIQLQVGRKYNY